MRRRIRKAPTPPDSLILAAKLVFIAMAHLESIRPRIEKIQADLLASMDIRYVDKLNGRRGVMKNEGQPITDPDHMYMASDEDSKRYYDALDIAYRAAGYVDLQPGYCPLLMADHELTRAHQLLSEEALKFIPGYEKFTVTDLMCPMENYKKFINLTLRYVGPFVAAEGSASEILRNFLAHRS